MEMTWFWRNLFFSFLRAIFRETWAWDQAPLCKENWRAKRAERWTGEGETLSPSQTTARLASLDIYFFRLFPQRHQTQARETSTEMDVNCQCYCKKTNRQQFSMVCDLIDHGLCSETKRLRLVVPLAFFEHSDIISMVDRVQTMQNCCLFVKSWVNTIAQRKFSLVYYICIKNIANLSRFINTIYLGFQRFTHVSHKIFSSCGN